ncbi:MAG: hypothetical protein J7499_07880 [Sphingopyxis sp.]|nr:hypothetical protein [Sphingopyxis sp.]
MPTHDPLTLSQIELPNQIENAPITMSVGEMSTPRGKDIQFLLHAGFLKTQKGHTAQKVENTTFIYSRSNKQHP